MNALLLADRIEKSFGGTPVIRGITLAVGEAEVVGLFGPNGAGKTVLANILSGLLPPDRGRIFFDGKEITRLSMDARFRAGLSRTFQIPGPYPTLTVVESIRVALLCGRPEERGKPDGPDAIEAGVESILRRTGLFAQRFWPAARLSQGCLRRLEFARAISCRPRLILLDEIFSALSAKDEDELADLFRSLHAEDGISFLLISHNPILLAEMCDRVVAIEDGRVAWEGPPDGLSPYLSSNAAPGSGR